MASAVTLNPNHSYTEVADGLRITAIDGKVHFSLSARPYEAEHFVSAGIIVSPDLAEAVIAALVEQVVNARRQGGVTA